MVFLRQLLLFLLVLLLVACEKQKEISSQRPVSEVVLEEVVLDRFEGDTVRYRALLSRVRLDRAADRAAGERVRIDVFDDERAEPSVRVRATRARTTISSGVVELFDGTEMIDREGRVMKSERVTYDTKKDDLTTAGEVSLTGENFRAKGASLSGKPKAGNLEISGPTQAGVEPR